MDLVPGETITVQLPNFFGASVENFPVISIPNGRIREGSWHLQNQTLTLTVDKQLICGERKMIAGEETKIVIYSSHSNISLPERGVRKNSIKISSDAVNGRVLPSILKRQQTIGSFLVRLGHERGGPSIHFSNEQTEPTSFTILLRPQMQLMPGEAIWLTLTNFTRRVITSVSIDFEVSPTGALSVDFDSTLQSMKFTANKRLFPDEQLRVTILTSSQIFMRDYGIRWNQTGLALSSNAADGPVPPIDILTTNSVGTIFGTGIGENPPMLKYDPRVAGEVTTLFLQFICSMVIESGEIFLLHLPQFTRRDDSYAVIPIEVEHPSFRARWSGNASTLTLTAVNRIERNAPQLVTIPSSAGIMLPTLGMSPQHWLSIEINARAGKRSAVRLHTPPLGAFTGAVTLKYRSVVHQNTGVKQGKSGEPTELDLTFTPTMIILPGEYVKIYLNGFWGMTKEEITVLSYPAGTFEKASWAAETNLLTLTALTGVSILVRTRIVVPSSSSQIRLPVDGVKANQTSFWIQTNAVNGPVWNPGLYTPASGGSGVFTRSTLISDSEAVGVFQTPQVSWSRKSAASYTGIFLKFSSLMQLNIGDQITLLFPVFGGRNTSFTGFSSQNLKSGPVNGSWSVGTHLLQITVGSLIEVDKECVIQISSAAGLFIPEKGLLANDPR
jgi:hypothetical protein